MKILLTGKNGQVGWELERTLFTLGKVTALGSAELNLTDVDAVARMVRELKPDIIVNPAAHTAVDKAESEPDLAHAINGRAPGVFAELAREQGALLVHYSTDYVFDGSKAGEYVETDPTNPLGVYGASKLAGEQAIIASGCRHLILRTSWVYGSRGKNFLLTMRKLMQERPQLSVVNDQQGAPTWSRLIAEATTALLRQRDLLGSAREIVNVAGGSYCTWYEFAAAIRAQLAAQGAQQLAELKPITTAEYPTPARRPANSRLSTAKLQGFGVDVLDLQQQLALV